MEEGHNNCKVVGRGTASSTTWDILQFLMKKAPQYYYKHYFTKALNMKGFEVDELHIMVTMRDKFSQNNGSRNTNQFNSANSNSG